MPQRKTKLDKTGRKKSKGNQDRWAKAFEALDKFPRDFEVPRDQTQQERPGLDDLFPELKRLE